MSSSYGRPGIGRVNVTPGSTRTSKPSVSLPSGSTVTPNAPYRDDRSPQTAYNNKMQDAKLVGDFLNFFTDTVQPQMAAAIDRSAQKEAQKVIDAFPSGDITATGSEEYQDAYNSLSNRAKTFVTEARAATAVASYPAALEGAYAAEPILSSPGDSPEQIELRAQAQARARANARTAVGLDKLPTYQLAVNSDSLAKADGVVSGQAYRMRMGRQAQLNEVALIQAGGVAIAKGFKDLRIASAADTMGDQPATVGTRKVLEATVAEIGQNFGPLRQAQILAGSIQQAITKTNDPEERLELIQMLKEQTVAPLLGADGQTDVLDVPLTQGGTTIRMKLEEFEAPAIKASDKAVMGRFQLKLFQLEAEGKHSEMLDHAMSHLELLDDPANYSVLIRAYKQSQQIVESPEMRAAGFRMEEKYIDGGSTRDVAAKLFKDMITAKPGTYTVKDIEEMGKRASLGGPQGSRLEPARKEYNAIAQIQGNDTDVRFAEFYGYAQGPSAPGKPVPPATNGKNYTATGQAQKAIFDQLVRAKYYEKWEQRDPTKWDPEQARRDAMKEVVGEQREGAGAGSAQAQTPKSSYTAFANNSFKVLSQVAQRNGNRLSPDSIPKEALAPEVYRAWTDQNPGKSFDSLTGRQKQTLLVQSIQRFEKYNPTTGLYENYTEKEALVKAREMLDQAEKESTRMPAANSQRIPKTVPVQPVDENEDKYISPAQKAASELLERSVDYIQKDAEKETDIPLYEGVKRWFNGGGLGPQSMSYVNGFLNMVTGAAPATAQELSYNTPDALQALRQSWSTGQRGLSTPPMPQVPASTPVRPVPAAVSNDQHELFVMVGVAEGTRTAAGGYTQAYYGHRDSGDGNWNRGTVSGGRGTSMSPGMVDKRWMGILTGVQQRMRPFLIVYGLQPGTQGYNRVMFNMLDLEVQSPAAARDFAGKLPQMKASGWTVEAIAKARADSFINPQTGRLEASGFGNSYQRLIQDQRSRAGVYDYRRRM
jgi:hypothetical protein